MSQHVRSEIQSNLIYCICESGMVQKETAQPSKNPGVKNPSITIFKSLIRNSNHVSTKSTYYSKHFCFYCWVFLNKKHVRFTWHTTESAVFFNGEVITISDPLFIYASGKPDTSIPPSFQSKQHKHVDFSQVRFQFRQTKNIQGTWNSQVVLGVRSVILANASWTWDTGEPRQKPSYFPLHRLFNRDPYSGLLQSPYNWVVKSLIIPIYPKQLGALFSLLRWSGEVFVHMISGCSVVTDLPGYK